MGIELVRTYAMRQPARPCNDAGFHAGLGTRKEFTICRPAARSVVISPGGMASLVSSMHAAAQRTELHTALRRNAAHRAKWGHDSHEAMKLPLPRPLQQSLQWDSFRARQLARILKSNRRQSDLTAEGSTSWQTVSVFLMLYIRDSEQECSSLLTPHTGMP